MVDQDVRRSIREQLFAHVGQLADIDFQRATWLDPDMQNPHFSCVEFVECFYDLAPGSYDETDPTAMQAPLGHQVRQGVLSEIERDLIWPVHLALIDFKPPDYYDHNAILASPTWLAVTAAAINARDALMAIVEPEEIAYFENQLPDASEKRWP